MDAIDVRHILPSIRMPTLILHRTGELNMQIEQSRYVAAHIPGARLVELPGIDHLTFVGDVDALVDEIEAFVTGARPASKPNHVLATVLVSEIAGAAGRAVALGDRRWADVQDRFQALAQRDSNALGAKSSPWVTTGSRRRSTDRPAQFAARGRSTMEREKLGSRPVPDCTPASARCGMIG